MFGIKKDSEQRKEDNNLEAHEKIEKYAITENEVKCKNRKRGT